MRDFHAIVSQLDGLKREARVDEANIEVSPVAATTAAQPLTSSLPSLAPPSSPHPSSPPPCTSFNAFAELVGFPEQSLSWEQ